MGKAEGQRLSGPQTDRRPVQEFGLVTGLGTVSYWSGVRLPRSIGQIPPRRFPKSGFVDLGGRGGGALFLNLYNDIFIVNGFNLGSLVPEPFLELWIQFQPIIIGQLALGTFDKHVREPFAHWFEGDISDATGDDSTDDGNGLGNYFPYSLFGDSDAYSRCHFLQQRVPDRFC